MSQRKTDGLYLSPEQQDLLMVALNSNHSPNQSGTSKTTPTSLNYTPNMSVPGSGNLDFSDESPFLDFDPDAGFDDSFDDYENARMIGDIPDDSGDGGLHEKRKSFDGDDDDDEGGGKRREGGDKVAKKPGRKPLTNEPTSKRKAQNRAAQRAFRERKEQHLKDLETKVEDLEKTSESANHENGLLRAQVERLQVELKEYRKRLSWISSNGLNRSQSVTFNKNQNSNSSKNGNDFHFEFPKFGDLPPMPGTNLFSKKTDTQKSQANAANRSATLPTPGTTPNNQSVNGRRSASGTSATQTQPARFSSLSQSPVSNGATASPKPAAMPQAQGSVDSLSGLFSPSILEASRHSSMNSYFPNSSSNLNGPMQNARGSLDNGRMGNNIPGFYSASSVSNSDSPSSSNESHHAISSIGTSPEPSLNSPANKLNEFNLNTIGEDNQATFGGYDNGTGFGTSDSNFGGINWLAQQNNNSFDPILFGDYRETQDNILSQDNFGAFFNEAYPLPDLFSNDLETQDSNVATTGDAPKAASNLLQQVEAAKNGNEEVVPDNEKPMSCNKIWDRLQSMEKFRNGEIDIDNLCSELRSKAKCSEGGAVVDRRDVDKILGM